MKTIKSIYLIVFLLVTGAVLLKTRNRVLWSALP